MMQRLFPAPTADLAINEVYADLDWAPRAGRPLVALNMVSSVDGRATVNSSAAGIGSSVDHTLMRALRASADALLHGAGTVRADRVGKGVPDEWVPRRLEHGLAPQPLLAVITASGDVPLRQSLFAEPERVVVFVAARTPAAAVERLRSRARVVAVGEERPDVGEAVRVLGREYGVRHVLCEGGPTLNHSLLTAQVLDELFLTLAPKMLAGDGLPLVVGPALAAIRLRLRSLYTHDSELFLRYSVGESTQEPAASTAVNGT